VKKSSRVDVDVLPHELNRWKAAAEACGMPVDAWVRETVNVALIPPARETPPDSMRRSDYGREHRRARREVNRNLDWISTSCTCT
jgi:hypothetical protein